MTAEEMRSYEKMVRTARRMLEETENRRDIADLLYRYNAKALTGGGGMILPGDVMFGVPGGMVSSRGMAVAMSPDEISELVDGGALDKLFCMDDINAPDFSDVIEHVLAEAGAQGRHADASRYYLRTQGAAGPTTLAESVAVYDVPAVAGETPRTVSVERNGGGTMFRSGVRDDIGTNFRECTYEEFNPGGRAILFEARSVNTERESRSAAYERMRAAYLDNGGHEVTGPQSVARPEDAVRQIKGYAQMSASEKLSAMRDATDRYDQYQKDVAEQAAARDAEEQWSPERRGFSDGAI